jgi:hypothetical protein
MSTEPTTTETTTQPTEFRSSAEIFRELCQRPAAEVAPGQSCDWIHDEHIDSGNTVGSHLLSKQGLLNALSLDTSNVDLDNLPDKTLTTVLCFNQRLYATRVKLELVELKAPDEVATVLPNGDPEGDLTCACGRTWFDFQLQELTPETLFTLVKPGDTVPMGICRACGEGVDE